MGLNYGISYGRIDEHSGEDKQIAEIRFQRLSDGEKEFYHSDPFFRLGLMHLMVTTDIRMIVPSSVPVLIKRYGKVDAYALVSLLYWVCTKCLRREVDPEDICVMSENLLTSFGPKLNESIINKLLGHWLLDRFGGCSTNIYTKTDTEWRTKLKEQERDDPKVVATTHEAWEKEREALFKEWSKELIAK